jgi:hypothetical protein
MSTKNIENVLLSDLFKIPNIVKRQLQNKQNINLFLSHFLPL